MPKNYENNTVNIKIKFSSQLRGILTQVNFYYK